MRCVRLISILFSAVLLSLVVALQVMSLESRLKEYKEFHDVLHPLEHEAMPKKDYESIRNKADDLVRLGNAIIKLGVPRGTKPSQVQAFEQELSIFNNALKHFAKVAKGGKDENLGVSFEAVHDSYELLTGMLPQE